MKTKEILKRSYYALTIGLVFIWMYVTTPNFLDYAGTWAWSLRHTSFLVLLSLGICWVMTRQSKPVNFKWYAGIIVSLTLLYIYMPMLLSNVNLTWDNLAFTLFLLLIIGCSACAILSVFMSNTRYHNILPNQSKGVSCLFRGVSWFGQLIIWGLTIVSLVEGLLYY